MYKLVCAAIIGALLFVSGDAVPRSLRIRGQLERSPGSSGHKSHTILSDHSLGSIHQHNSNDGSSLFANRFGDGSASTDGNQNNLNFGSITTSLLDKLHKHRNTSSLTSAWDNHFHNKDRPTHGSILENGNDDKFSHGNWGNHQNNGHNMKENHGNWEQSQNSNGNIENWGENQNSHKPGGNWGQHQKPNGNVENWGEHQNTNRPGGNWGQHQNPNGNVGNWGQQQNINKPDWGQNQNSKGNGANWGQQTQYNKPETDERFGNQGQNNIQDNGGIWKKPQNPHQQLNKPVNRLPLESNNFGNSNPPEAASASSESEEFIFNSDELLELDKKHSHIFTRSVVYSSDDSLSLESDESDEVSEENLHLINHKPISTENDSSKIIPFIGNPDTTQPILIQNVPLVDLNHQQDTISEVIVEQIPSVIIDEPQPIAYDNELPAIDFKQQEYPTEVIVEQIQSGSDIGGQFYSAIIPPSENIDLKSTLIEEPVLIKEMNSEYMPTVDDALIITAIETPSGNSDILPSSLGIEQPYLYSSHDYRKKLKHRKKKKDDSDENDSESESEED